MEKRKITDEQIIAAHAKYNELLPTLGVMNALEQVAKQYGISSRTLRRYLKAVKPDGIKAVEWKKGVYMKDRARIQRAYDHYRKGHTIKETSEIFGIPTSTLHRSFVKLCDGNFVPNDYTKETVKSFTHATVAKIKATKMSERNRIEVEQWLASLPPDIIASIPVVNTTTENNYSKFTTGNGYDVADSYDLAYSDY